MGTVWKRSLPASVCRVKTHACRIFICNHAQPLFSSHSICSIWAMAVAIVSVAQMREWEKATWATGQTEQAVITRVGEALVAPMRKMNSDRGLVLILAGKG